MPSSSPLLHCSGFALPESIPWSTSHQAGWVHCSERGGKEEHAQYLISNLLAQPYGLIQGEARHQLCGQDMLAAQLVHYSWDIKEGVVFQQLPRGWRQERKRLGALKAARPLHNTSHSTVPSHHLSPHPGCGWQELISSVLTVQIKSPETTSVTYSWCQFLRSHLLPEQWH